MAILKLYTNCKRKPSRCYRLPERAVLETLYTDWNYSTRAIARIYEVRIADAAKMLDRHGISWRKMGGKS